MPDMAEVSERGYLWGKNGHHEWWAKSKVFSETKLGNMLDAVPPLEPETMDDIFHLLRLHTSSLKY